MPRTGPYLKFVVAPVAMSVGLAACLANKHRAELSDVDPASLSGQVSGTPIEASNSERYKNLPGVKYDLPAALPTNPQPIYPLVLLSQHLAPVIVRVRLVVNEDGRVIQTQPLGPVNEGQLPFLAAVEFAVLKWQFFPLVQITDGPGKSRITVGDVTTTYAGHATRLPFHQDYVFTFQQVGGEAVVTAEQPHAEG